MRLRFSIKHLAVAMLLALALPALSGCQLFGGSGAQTLADPSGAFHFEVPGSWTATVTPGLITMYGGEDMPSQDAAIDDVPWYFVLTTRQGSETELDKQVVELAKNRSKSRGWKDVTLGKPKPTMLGGVTASEMDLSATDDLGRPFEGKLLLSQVDPDVVLVFAFTAPGSFEKHGKFEDLKQNFYWHSLPVSEEASDKAGAAKKKPAKSTDEPAKE